MSIFNTNRWMTIVVLLLLAANITTLALLWTRGAAPATGKPGPPQHGGPFEYLSRELSFDQQQREDYAVLRDEHRSKAREMEEDIRQAKDDYFALLKQPSVSDSALVPYLDKITSIERELDLLTFHHFQQVRKICTPQQQQRFDDIIQQALHSMRPKGPPPGGRPPH